jgi:hypothetical protein
MKIVDDPASARHRGSVARFAIGLYDQGIIKDNARDADPEQKQETLSSGFTDKRGEITRKGWDQINEDTVRIERNALAWMRQKFGTVRDDGHDGHDDLVGSFWFDPHNPEQADLIELAADTGRQERIDMVDTSFGDLGRTAFYGISDFGASVLGGAITFFDVKPEDMEIIEETLEQYAHFHDARQERDES